MKWVVIILILGLLCRIFEAQIKGFLGEKIVSTSLNRLPKEHYKIVQDIILQTSYGTTQIDHVVVSIYGIFVIETKNYKGWITGSEYGEQWTKNMYGKKYSFRNPLKQNYAHVKALQEHLDIPEDKFIPIIAFSDDSTIKVKTNKPVVYMSRLRRTIASYKDVQFRDSELDTIVSKIKGGNHRDIKSKRQHVAEIKNKTMVAREKVHSGLCPKCDGQLIRRKGKYGFFTGCSNYPKCTYTQK